MTEKTTKIIYGIVITALIVSIAAWFYLKPAIEQEKNTETTVIDVQPIIRDTPPTIALETPEPIFTPIAIEPTPTPTPQIALPPLNQSDTYIKEQFAKAASFKGLLKLMTQEEIVRKVARAVYQSSEGKIVKQYRPVASPRGKFESQQVSAATEISPAVFVISEANYARYEPYISALTNIAPTDAANLYRNYQPLLETAYSELGLNGGSFHDALKATIDIALSTPDISSETDLIRPSVMYKYADTDIESLSQVQKLLIRMGKENRTKVMSWLKRFQQSAY